MRGFRRSLALLSPVFVVLLGGTYLLVSDRTLWGEWLTVWPPILWGVLLLVRALVIWLEGWRKLALTTAGLTVLFVSATTELRAVWRRHDPGRIADFDRLRRSDPPAPGSVALRVVSWNVAGHAPLTELEALDPDVCLLQEIGEVEAAWRTSPHWRSFHWTPSFDPGTLTRYPVRVLKTARVGPWTAPQLLLLDLPAGRRIVLANVRLMLPSVVVSIASFGDLVGVGGGHRDRLEQFPRLVRLITAAAAEQGADGIILAGDFNTPGGMASLDPLKPLLRDVWRDAGRGWGATMTAEMPLSRIDQAWVSREIRVVDAHVRRAGESDHRMLVVDLVVEAGRR